MFKILALISVLTSAVLAQQPPSTNSASPNTLIPSGISAPCNTFLTKLNNDTTLANCFSMMTNVTSAFNPGKPEPSSSQVTDALTNLCANSVNAACPQSSIRQSLTDFYAACPNELANDSPQGVRTIYDVLYTFTPLRLSVCSKDNSGNWCVNAQDKSAREFDEDSDKFSFGLSKLSALFSIKKNNGALTRRDQAALMPDLHAIASKNITFLFITSDLSESQLCVTCTRQVITAFINFESNAPFAYGMNNSVLLAGQSAIYQAVQKKCSDTFLSDAEAAASGLSSGISSAISTYGADYQRIIALVMGAVTLVVSIVL